MNIPKEVLKLVHKGGYKPGFLDKLSWAFLFTDNAELNAKSSGNFALIVLDARFWQALGKVLEWGKQPYHTETGEEWGERICNHCGTPCDIQPKKETECNHAHYPEACRVCFSKTQHWDELAHQFCTLIYQGKETETFWQEIIGE